MEIKSPSLKCRNTICEKSMVCLLCLIAFQAVRQGMVVSVNGCAILKRLLKRWQHFLGMAGAFLCCWVSVRTQLLGISHQQPIINVMMHWEQSFYVCAAIYSETNPSRAREIWQYVRIINSVASGYQWNNVSEFTANGHISEKILLLFPFFSVT